MIQPPVIFLVALVACLGWLAGGARLFQTDDGARWRDLAAYAFFLALLALFSPQFTSLAAGVVAASAILGVGGWVAYRQGLGRRGLRLAEIAAFLCLARAGIEIQFIQRPSGGYFYLDGMSTIATVLWFAGFVEVLRMTRVLPGLCQAVQALLSYMMLGALMLQPKAATPDTLAMALVLTACTTACWLSGYRSKAARIDSIAVSLWSMALAVLPVASATKRIALVAVVTPVLVLAAPVLFFTYVMMTSYLAPKLASRNGDRWAFRWNISLERTVDLVMLFCLGGNLIALVYLSTGSWLWPAGLAMLSACFYWRAVGSVLLVDRQTTKNVGSGEPIEILGIPFIVESFDDVVGRIERMIESGRPHFLVTPDALSLLRTTQDDAYARVVRRADLRVPDGAGVVWAADILYESPLLERVPGVELVDRLAALAEARGWGLYLLGARPEVLPAAVAALRRRHPALRIVGARDGFFTPAEEPAIRDEINRLRPEILLVAMGVPKQEFWIDANLHRLSCSLMMGVGGTFDVLAGTAIRAPSWLGNAGLEWLFRVLREPHRLSRIVSLPLFVKEVLREKLIRGAAATENDSLLPRAAEARLPADF